MRSIFATVGLLAAASASAYAGPVFATGTPSFAVVTDTSTAMSASTMGNLAGAPDGNSATITGIDSNGGSNNDVFTITFALAPGQTGSGGSFSFLTGSGGGSWNGITLALTGVQWTGGASPGTNSGTYSVSGTINSASTTYTVTNIGWSSDFTGVVLTFTSTQGSNKTATFDAISATAVPEPATSALFALGSIGLGGFVWTKRRRRGAQRPSA